MKKAFIYKLEPVFWTLGVVCICAFFFTKYSSAQATKQAEKRFASAQSEVLKGDSYGHYAKLISSNDTAQAERAKQVDEALNDTVKGMDIIGMLEIPTLDIKAAVFPDTRDETLNLGVGRVKGTSYFGLPGNVAVAGHRDSFFRNLKDVREGEQVVVRHEYGIDVYKVESMKVVEPTDISVLKDGEGSTLTLITCYPFDFIGSAPQRFIVKATKVSS